MTQANCKWSL